MNQHIQPQGHRCDVACTHLLDIPPATLSYILQCLPFQQRLGVCTRVCRVFYTAAVAATSISIRSSCSTTRCDELTKWLQKHGDGVTALEANAFDRLGKEGALPCLSCLPCPHLQDLQLTSLSLLLAPSASTPGLLGSCTDLTRLVLRGCNVQQSPLQASGTLSCELIQLSALTKLQHLELLVRRPGYVGLLDTDWKHSDQALELPGSLLSRLVQLTHLDLSRQQLQSGAALEHLSALTALQHLAFDMFKHTLTAQLRHFRSLCLGDFLCTVDLNGLPPLTALTGLQVLQLYGAYIDPAMLTGGSQLLQLQLHCGKRKWDAAATAALLAGLATQQQLTRLTVSHHHWWSTPSAAAYSALTASSSLQKLELVNCEVPIDAWQQMFQPTRPLPHLQSLVAPLTVMPPEAEGRIVRELSRADLRAMVSCCPALETLVLESHFNISTATPLQQLTALTCLDAVMSFKDNAASIARLTGLHRLDIHSKYDHCQVTTKGLLQLTALQQLTYLQVYAAAWQPQLEAALEVTRMGGAYHVVAGDNGFELTVREVGLRGWCH